jgi:hypothetical protein
MGCVPLRFRLPPPEGVGRGGVLGGAWGGGILLMTTVTLAATLPTEINRYEDMD